MNARKEMENSSKEIVLHYLNKLDFLTPESVKKELESATINTYKEIIGELQFNINIQKLQMKCFLEQSLPIFSAREIYSEYENNELIEMRGLLFDVCSKFGHVLAKGVFHIRKDKAVFICLFCRHKYKETKITGIG